MKSRASSVISSTVSSTLTGPSYRGRLRVWQKRRHDGTVARVLIIVPSATYRATEFLSAARRMDIEVVTASDQAQAFAATMGDRFVTVDLADPKRAATTIVDFAHRVPLDAVVAVDDQGSLAAADAAERLGLVHNPPHAVAATRNKAEMRRRFHAAGVPQPRYRIIGERAIPTPKDVVIAAGELGYPIVCKPISLSGSRGVIRADDDREAVAALDRIARLLDTLGGEPRSVLVERFIPGREVAVEGLLVGGALRTLAIFDKPDPLDGPFFEETIYVTPSRITENEKCAVSRSIEAASTALGLVEGPVHGEVRLTDADELAVLEVAARTIGGRCSTALRFATGVSLEEIVLRHALGDAAIDASAGVRSSGVMMLPIAHSGTLVGVTGQGDALAIDGITGLEIAIAPGRFVAALPEGGRYLGFLFAEGATPEDVESSLRRGVARLAIEIEPSTVGPTP